MTGAETQRRYRQKQAAGETPKTIVILDTETDPFDAEHEQIVKPFLAVLYSEEWEPIILWDENEASFLDSLLAAIEGLPGECVIFAHNGGKFDYMFLMSRLRGVVKFKGRGIMSARVGRHELRDSFHIIPERLANIQKDAFDYTKLRASRRASYREEIVRYCLNDCKYLLGIVKAFVSQNGLMISIGQAAMYHLRKEYEVERLNGPMDAFLRNYFFGGRVECLAGKGHFVGRYRLYDVNSMYPHVMANYAHPIGNQYEARQGEPGPDTVFLEIECNNFGALIRRGDNGEISAEFPGGKFRTTIWEYEAARKLGLISRVKINWCIDCPQRSNFSRFIMPLYEKRRLTKKALQAYKAAGDTSSFEYQECKKDDILAKLLMNNAYGKFAQNPRRFKESYVTEPGEVPAPEHGEGWGELPAFRCDDYAIWERPNPGYNFNNVGTAASITGAARSILMEAIHRAKDPIYCDTDSLICRDLGGLEMSQTELGAWSLEAEFDEVLIAGKKLYACKTYADAGHKEQIKLRSKGVSGLTWDEVRAMLGGAEIVKVNSGPTLTKRGDQFYMRRTIRATAPETTRRAEQRVFQL